MFRWARRQLRQINYYAANRKRTRWTRAIDIALAASLLASWPMVWMVDQMYGSTEATQSGTGQLFQESDGALWATRRGEPYPLERAADATVYGNYKASIETERGGWPFASSWRRVQPVFDLEVFQTGQDQKKITLPADSPIRLAVEEVLLGIDVEEGVDRAQAIAQSAASFRWPGFFANGIVWTIGLALASWLMISLARWVWIKRFIAAHDHRHRRALKGRCGQCNYDLRGNEFAERCPECGTLVA